MADNSQIDPDFQKDYEYIRSDLKKVVLNNILFIALLVALYFANKQFGWLTHLEKLF